MARTLRVGEHAVGRVAVVGVGGEHGAQLAHPRGRLRRRGPSRRRSPAAGGRPRAGGRGRSRRRRRARRCRAGSARRARSRAARGSAVGSSERCSVNASRRSAPNSTALSSATAGARGELDQHAPVERGRRPAPITMIAPSIRPRETSGSAARATLSTVGRRRRQLAGMPLACRSGRPRSARSARRATSRRGRVALRGSPRPRESAGSASATTTPWPNPLRMTSERMPQHLVDLQRAGQPGAGGAEDLQAAGRGAVCVAAPPRAPARRARGR